MTSKAVPMGSATATPVASETSGQAIASLVCGIIGFIFLGIVLGPIAICLGMSAKKNINESEGRLKGDCMATAGIICGIVVFVLSIIWISIVVSSN